MGKKFIALFLISASLSLAETSSVISSGFEFVLQESPLAKSSLSAPYFQVNDRDCKAWVSVDIHDPRGPEAGGEVGHRDSGVMRRSGLVPGLHFDCQSRNILLVQVVCATVSRTSFWNPIPKILPSGKCHLKISEREESIDEGFKVSTYRRITVIVEAPRE